MKTKIIATLGPASSDKKMLEKLIEEGVNVFRLNFSHVDYAIFEKIISDIHDINRTQRRHIALLADLQGPKIRTGEAENGSVLLKTGSEINITPHEQTSNEQTIFINYPDLPKETKKGEEILIDDGKILLEVISSDGKNQVKALVKHGGLLKSKKGVNLPNTSISIPSLTGKDKKDIAFIMEHKFQWLALSFVRRSEDILHLKETISAYRRSEKMRIIAKIEKPEALNDLDNIIKISDGIMVARGDLGVELPLETLPLIQKDIVRKCMLQAKPVIIATQMMESMINNISPTRAEVNDVANSVLDGADALMLSGETSVGDHPVEVIVAMRKIITHIEENQENIYYKHDEPVDIKNDRFLSDSVIFNACQLARQSKASAILGMTHSGYSAFKIAAQRPRAGIFIFTNNHSLLSILSLVWGVRGFYYDKFVNTDHTIIDIKERLLSQNLISKGDIVVNIASTPLAERGKTNMLKISYV